MVLFAVWLCMVFIGYYTPMRTKIQMHTKKIMKLIDPNTGRMQCRICGDEHYASLKPRSNGNYYRGSWQCRHGCKLECHCGSTLKGARDYQSKGTWWICPNYNETTGKEHERFFYLD